MTAPLTPANCDLRGMPFMPLDVVRMLDSDLFALSTGDEFKAAVALWCKSWSQVPAGSLPTDDRVLAHLSGAGLRWRKVKDMALRGWVLCDDGRLYHPVVAEKAMEAGDRRGEWQDTQENKKTRQQRWRERCKALAEQLRAAGVTPPPGASLATLEEMVAVLNGDGSASTAASTAASTVDKSEIGKTGTGTGTGTGTSTSVSNETGGEPPDGFLVEWSELPLDKGSWRLAKHVLVQRGGKTTAQAGDMVGKWLKGGATHQQLWTAAEAAWRSGTEDPVPYITAALKGELAKDFDPMLQPEDWRQRRWMAEFVEGKFAWAPQRGPLPGDQGCRVSPEIQREFGVEPAAPAAVRGAA